MGGTSSASVREEDINPDKSEHYTGEQRSCRESLVKERMETIARKLGKPYISSYCPLPAPVGLPRTSPAGASEKPQNILHRSAPARHGCSAADMLEAARALMNIAELPQAKKPPLANPSSVARNHAGNQARKGVLSTPRASRTNQTRGR